MDPHVYPSRWTFQNEKIRSYEVSTNLFTYSKKFSEVYPVPFAKEGTDTLKNENINYLL